MENIENDSSSFENQILVRKSNIVATGAKNPACLCIISLSPFSVLV
jgi:hypothetical protein